VTVFQRNRYNVPFLSWSFKEMSSLFFFSKKANFFLLGSGKKNPKHFFFVFLFFFGKRGRLAHFGQLNSFFDNSAVLRTGIFLIFIILLLS